LNAAKSSLLFLLLLIAPYLCAQQSPETFRWVDFHSAKDQDVVVWVTRTLEPEKWTAIREIGVQYDAALVVTTLRSVSQSTTAADTFTLWSVSLTDHSLTPLLKGVNLRLLDWLLFNESKGRELVALYDDCTDCDATTYFTAFHYDVTQHGWAARWMRGNQAVPVWSTKPPDGVTLTQVYAGLAEPNGRQYLSTWNHFDYGKQKDPEDFVYRYDLDPFSGLERTQLLSGKEAEAMKLRLCGGQGAVPGLGLGLARGQDALLCQQLVHPRTERKPVTTPPANNHGKSSPPGAQR
jgi:hypothetical protein